MQNPKSSSRLGLRHVVYLWHCCAPLPLFVGNFNLTKGTLLSILLLSVYCFTLHISKTCRRSVTACEFKTCAKSHIILFPIQIFLMCMSWGFYAEWWTFSNQPINDLFLFILQRELFLQVKLVPLRILFDIHAVLMDGLVLIRYVISTKHKPKLHLMLPPWFFFVSQFISE